MGYTVMEIARVFNYRNVIFMSVSNCQTPIFPIGSVVYAWRFFQAGFLLLLRAELQPMNEETSLAETVGVHPGLRALTSDALSRLRNYDKKLKDAQEGRRSYVL